MDERYWLRDTTPEGKRPVWREVTLVEFICCEQENGFDSTPRSQPATDGFSGRCVRGKVTFGPITPATCGDDPDFWESERIPLAAPDALPIAS